MNLLEKAQDRIIIMPGGGTKAEHVPELKKSGWLKEVHASCKVARPSRNKHINPGLSFSAMPLDFDVQLGVDEELVKAFKVVL